MAVDGVEAGVADPVRKPAAVDAGVRIEHGLRLLEPVDIGRRLAPKTERIALPARVDLVIAARTGVHGAASKHLSAIFDPTTTAMQERRASRHSPQDFSLLAIRYSPVRVFARLEKTVGRINMAATTPYDTDLPRNAANFQPLTPLSFLARAAQVYPDQIAIIHGARSWTYREFYARARRLASALVKRGIERGDTVA